MPTKEAIAPAPSSSTSVRAAAASSGPATMRHAPPETYYALAGKYGLTINDEWIEDLGRTYNVEL